MDRWEDPPPDKYLGLTAAQFNLAFLLVAGIIAAAVALYFGGLDEVRDFLGRDPGDGRPAAVAQSTPPPPATTATTNAAPPLPEPVYEPATCAFGGGDPTVECGYLTVPESRTNFDGTTIRLHVAVIKALSDDPAPDPIVYLSGGPGHSPLRSARFSLVPYRLLAAERDVIVIDQRGVGYSEPALDCHDFLKQSYDLVREEIAPEEGVALVAQAAAECRDRWLRRSVDLAAYTSAESAADLDALRTTLGYDEWNLYGVSYGTRLALTAMRDFPDGIRSVVLDSTYPLEADLYSELPANAERAFSKLFDGCAADAACNSDYPNLEAVFFDLVDELNEEPVSVDIDVTNRFTLEHVDKALINGDSLIGFLFDSLYSTEFIPLLPEVIYDVRDGNLELLALIVEFSLSSIETMSYGMHFSVQCGEEVPFTSQEALDAARDAYPRLRVIIDSEATPAICESWGAGAPAATENEPVTADIPALVLAGEYDPITPPAWGKQVAASLSGSFFFEFPDTGHGVAFSDECAFTQTLEFFDDPSSEPADCL